MGDYDFYDAQSEASQIKTRIVAKYFSFWTKIIVPRVKQRGKRLAYIDLFAGPGRYIDVLCKLSGEFGILVVEQRHQHLAQILTAQRLLKY